MRREQNRRDKNGRDKNGRKENRTEGNRNRREEKLQQRKQLRVTGNMKGGRQEMNKKYSKRKNIV